jgi:hypothetical protein
LVVVGLGFWLQPAEAAVIVFFQLLQLQLEAVAAVDVPPVSQPHRLELEQQGVVAAAAAALELIILVLERVVLAHLVKDQPGEPRVRLQLQIYDQEVVAGALELLEVMLLAMQAVTVEMEQHLLLLARP